MSFCTDSILLIHGLTGHPIQSWSRKGVCWPYGLLPSALPVPVRVLTFGYDAGRFGGDANLDIEDAALQLISELERVRGNSEVWFFNVEHYNETSSYVL